MKKNLLIIILCVLFNGCVNIQHKIDGNSEGVILSSERYSGVDQNFFEITSNNFRKDDWFYSYHPEHIGYPRQCILLTKKAPEPDIDRLIYKIDCFGNNPD
jgi:hypothetical protein